METISLFDGLKKDSEDKDKNGEKETKIYSVSDYLDLLNAKISEEEVVVRGEVSSVSFRNGHAYFSLKDENDQSLLNCFMWANNYKLSGVELTEGLEILLHGVAEIYKPYGKLSFKTDLIELVGEGALKKAYEELKNKLEKEGLFAPERKRPIPEFPHRIGLITSHNGAVINDFMSNIGRFGYEIIFVDSRVEGASSIKDLTKAVDYFFDKEIDVLVIIRGGGSLESLQAFNNETLVRKIADFPQPVICGIGHDKDEPLINFVADLKCSTPSIVATSINSSWEQGLHRLLFCEKTLFFKLEESLNAKRTKLETAGNTLKDFYQTVFHKFEQLNQSLKNGLGNIAQGIRHESYKLEQSQKKLAEKFKLFLGEIDKKLKNYEQALARNNPERQLKLGYSLLTLNGKIIRSCEEIKKADVIVSRLSDGSLESEVKKIFKN